MGGEQKYDLEDRLIDFAVPVPGIAEKLPKTPPGNHVSGQLVRSGTSPAANYGEVQGTESRKDFVHKFGIILKELKESHIKRMHRTDSNQWKKHLNRTKKRPLNMNIEHWIGY